MKRWHRYSIHITSPSVKLTTSCFFFFFFTFCFWSRCVYKKTSLRQRVWQESSIPWKKSCGQHHSIIKDVPLKDRQYNFSFLHYLCSDEWFNWLVGDSHLWYPLLWGTPEPSRYKWARSLSVSTPRFVLWKNVSCDLDMCRLAACFPFSALSPQLMSWKLCSCHLSCEHSHEHSLLQGLNTEHKLATNTWKDKCLVKLNKHIPDMLNSCLSVLENSRSGAWFLKAKIVRHLKGHF